MSGGSLCDSLVPTLTTVTTLFSHREPPVAILTAMLDVLVDVLAEIFTLSSSSLLFTPAVMTTVSSFQYFNVASLFPVRCAVKYIKETFLNYFIVIYS